MQDRHDAPSRPALLGRLAGVAAVGFVAIAIMPGNLGGPYYDTITSAKIVEFASQNTTALYVGAFLGGLGPSVLAAFVLLTVAISGRRGVLGTAAIAGMTATVAIDWVSAATSFALADAGTRQQADAGIVALFSLVKSMTWADGFTFGIAALALGVLALRRRALPAVLAWLGIVVGAFHLVELPLQLVTHHAPGGPTAPIGVILGLLWILASGVMLLIRPVRRVDAAAEQAELAAVA